jgi:hypothetical protein
MDYNQKDAIKNYGEQTAVINAYCEKYPPVNNLYNLDGIVDFKEWNNAENRKVCFFLKEAYRSKTNDYSASYMYPLIKELNEYKPWRMWKKAARWSCLINEIGSVSSVSDLEIDGERQNNYMKKTAVMNIIKTIDKNRFANDDKSIGNKTTGYQSLKEQLVEDADLLLLQLETIKPKFIICGYTFSLFVKLLMFRDGVIEKKEFLNNDYKDSEGDVDKYLNKFANVGKTIYWNSKCVIIDTYHFANFKHRQPSEKHIEYLKEYFGTKDK